MTARGKRRIGPLGCLGLLFFLLVETVAGVAAAALCYPHVRAVTGAIFPAREGDLAGVVAIIICFIPAGVVAWLIDRICLRITGYSVFEEMPHIPNIP